ncbi:helix-turn-helix domain-containing protein [Algibacillus agarilyticus]|uniref:helix-turn-helix domain-containing protein n=1 Tax=Algibacillus agarilyticus TaxID=2234133 RepID=UPI000DCF8240|nr:helix-turn-helix transcriptional regulator [Algibacillus agarilyticus]
MNNWKLTPHNSVLKHFIECYWFIQKSVADNIHTHPKLNPDPHPHLILCESKQAYDYSTEAMNLSGRACHLILPHTKTFVIDHTNPFSLLGIKFKPHALYVLRTLFGFTLVPGANNVLPIDTAVLLSLTNNALKHILALAIIEPAQVCETMDEVLLNFLQKDPDDFKDKHWHLVDAVLSIMSESLESHSQTVFLLNDVHKQLNCSQRTIERSFLRVTGLTLKQYQSMQRLEKILNYLYLCDEKQINWANIASEFDFSDQPHLIRYLKQNLGMTPGEYTLKRDLTIDVYGNFA